MQNEALAGTGERFEMHAPSHGSFWEEITIGIAAVIIIIAATVLPWAKVHLSWTEILTGQSIRLGNHSFKLLEVSWLVAAVIAVSTICLLGLLWKNRKGEIAIACSLLLLACSIYYLVNLANKAYDALGFYRRIIENLGSIPMIGPTLESVIKERLHVSALPNAGLFLFIAADIVMLIAGAFLLRRKRRWKKARDQALSSQGPAL